MSWIDLSLPLRNGMPVYPGDPPVRIGLVYNHEEHQMQVSRLEMGSHTGTHLDAPRHFFPSGTSVDQLPPDLLIGPALVVSLPLKKGRQIDLTRLDLTRRQKGDALLLSTGWDKKAGSDEFFQDLPLFAPGSTAFLQSLGIRLFGLDLPTVCEFSLPPQPLAMHLGLLGSGMILVESLVGLLPLAGKRVEFMALPLRLAEGDGSPVRALARVIDP